MSRKKKSFTFTSWTYFPPNLEAPYLGSRWNLMGKVYPESGATWTLKFLQIELRTLGKGCVRFSQRIWGVCQKQRAVQFDMWSKMVVLKLSVASFLEKLFNAHDLKLYNETTVRRWISQKGWNLRRNRYLEVIIWQNASYNSNGRYSAKVLKTLYEM